MALQTKKGSVLPTGAVAVTREAALEYQKKFIRNWPSEIDVLFLKYGCFMTSASTLISSGVILKFFKQFFNLRHSPILYLSYLTSSVLPSLFSFIITEKFLTENVLLMKMDCPVCDELKFGVTQLYVSVVYPAIFGYFSLGSRAQLENTYYLPNVKTQPREFWSETFRIFKKSTKVLKFTAISQSVWILFLPYVQNKQLFNVMSKAEETVVNEDLDDFNELENEFY